MCTPQFTAPASELGEAVSVTHGEARPAGLYESLITDHLERSLAGMGERTDVDPAEQPHVLARHVYDLTVHALRAERDPTARLAIVNQLIETIGRSDDHVVQPVRQLTRISPAPGPGQFVYEDVRPRTPLSDAALLTNAPDEPSLGAELRAELDTADDVDLLCAFVKWYGLRVLEPQLRRIRERGAPLRVITTTYVGATERVALER